MSTPTRVFVERFVLAVLVVLFGAIVVTNPFHLSPRGQFVALVGDVIVAAMFSHFTFRKRPDVEGRLSSDLSASNEPAIRVYPAVSAGSETPGSPPIIPERFDETELLPLTEPKQSLDPPPKVFTTVPAEYLTRLFTEHTDLQAQKLVELHKGKWIRVSGRVSDVSGRDRGAIQVMLYPSSFEPLLESMMLVFDAGAHADRAATLRRGDVVSVEGQISRVSRMNIKLDHCEFVPNAGESPDSRVKPR